MPSSPSGSGAVPAYPGPGSRPWHHRPCHLFVPDAYYFVTAGSFYKQHFFRGDERLALLQAVFFDAFEDAGWQLQAWALFSNHYHVMALSPEKGPNLKSVIQRLHSESARDINRLDGAAGRRIWFQYWDTCLTYEHSYYARLNYVHNNPAKHGLVRVSANYPYCSANWFRFEADRSFRRKVESFRYDRIRVVDDF